MVSIFMLAAIWLWPCSLAARRQQLSMDTRSRRDFEGGLHGQILGRGDAENDTHHEHHTEHHAEHHAKHHEHLEHHEHGHHEHHEQGREHISHNKSKASNHTHEEHKSAKGGKGGKVVWLGKWKLWRHSGPTHCDIMQGQLASCYILATLAAVAHNHARIIKDMFVHRERWNWTNPVFTVRFQIGGKPTDVAVTTEMPVSENHKTLFSKPHEITGNTAVWHMLIEKAWAKLYRSYKDTESGFLYEAIRGLTGAPTKVFAPDDNGGFEKELVWSTMHNATGLKFPMVSGVLPEPKTTALELGLAMGHAYGILGAKLVKGKRVVRMYNPWGLNRYTGELAGDKAPENLRCNEFMMTFDEFHSAFNYVEVALVRVGYVLSPVAVPTGTKSHVISFHKQQPEPFAVQLQWPSWRMMTVAECGELQADAWLEVTPPQGEKVLSKLVGVYQTKGLASVWANMPGGTGKYSVTVHAHFPGGGSWLKSVTVNTYAREMVKWEHAPKHESHSKGQCASVLDRFKKLDNADQIKKHNNDTFFPTTSSSIGPPDATCGDAAAGIQKPCKDFDSTWAMIKNVEAS